MPESPRKEYHRKHYLENKASIIKRTLEYYHKNKEALRAHRKKWQQDHKEERNKVARECYNLGPKRIYSTIKTNSKNHGFKELISQGDFIAWYTDSNKVCAYCGVPAALLGKNPQCRMKWTRLSVRLTIDRKDNTNGYVNGNMVLACPRCNFIKSDVLSYEEMLVVGVLLFSKWRH